MDLGIITLKHGRIDEALEGDKGNDCYVAYQLHNYSLRLLSQ